MGNNKGPSVVSKVLAAFLLPIVVFIAALAVFERVLAGVIDTKGLQTALSFPVALLVTSVFILIIRAINKQFRPNNPAINCGAKHKNLNITPPRGRG